MGHTTVLSTCSASRSTRHLFRWLSFPGPLVALGLGTVVGMQHVYVLGRSRGPGNIWPIAIVFWVLCLLPFCWPSEAWCHPVKIWKEKDQQAKSC